MHLYIYTLIHLCMYKIVNNKRSSKRRESDRSQNTSDIMSTAMPHKCVGVRQNSAATRQTPADFWDRIAAEGRISADIPHHFEACNRNPWIFSIIRRAPTEIWQFSTSSRRDAPDIVRISIHICNVATNSRSMSTCFWLLSDSHLLLNHFSFIILFIYA